MPKPPKPAGTPLARHPKTTRVQMRKRPDPLLERVIEEFLYHHQQVSSAKTARSYEGVLGLFFAWLEDRIERPPLLSDVTLEQVGEWSRELMHAPKRAHVDPNRPDASVSWETRRTYLRTLRVFSNWLPLPPHTFCDESPLRHLAIPRPSDTYEMPMSEDELAQLIAASREDSLTGARDTAMLLTLIDGGMRAMELAGLRIGDVTLESGLLLVSRGKGNKSRIVTVGNETRAALRRYAVIRDSLPDAKRSADAPFFPTLQGRQYTYAGIRSWLRRLAERAGVPRAHLHLFRHTSAVETLDVGGDLRTLQLKLGHSSITTTQRYLNMGTKRLSERQRQFSPVDNLQILTPRPDSKKRTLPRWRREEKRS